MTRTVVWKPSAQQDLAALWLASSNRKGVTAATHQIERMLATNAENVGQISFDTVSTLVVLPLGVEFEIIEEDRLVWVLSVWDSSKSLTP